MLADLVGKEPVTRRQNFTAKLRINAQRGRRFATVGEQIPDDRHVHRGSCADGSVLTIGRGELIFR